MNKVWKGIGSCLLVLAAAFGSFCTLASSKKADIKLSPQEKTWMEPFFRGVMLQHQGIYTLCGSKPMTMIPLDAQEDAAKTTGKKRIIPENYHLMENWENWEKAKSKYPLQRFAFFKRADADVDTIYFADLTKVALVLQENYNVFKKETGLDFDALDESLKLEQGSEFWSKVFDHPGLSGLVLGYGMKNSFCFQWKYCASESQERITNALTFSFSDQPHSGKATFDKLTLPIFASFFSDGQDEVIEKYRREREAIRDAFEDKDFVALTLRKLTQVDQ